MTTRLTGLDHSDELEATHFRINKQSNNGADMCLGMSETDTPNLLHDGMDCVSTRWVLKTSDRKYIVLLK